MAISGAACFQAVVNHCAIELAGLVNGNGHAARAQGQVCAHACKADIGCGCLQRRPLTCHGFRVGIRLFSEQGQAKFNARQTQPGCAAHQAAVCVEAAANAGKAAQARAANAQHVYRHATCRLGDLTVCINFRIAQRDRLRAFLDGQVALNAEETADIQRQQATGLQQLASRAVHGQLHARAAASGDGQVSFTGAVVNHQSAWWDGCNGDGRTRLLHVQRGVVAARHVGSDQIGHVNASQCAAEANLQRLAGPGFNMRGSACDTGHGQRQCSLHLGLRHAGVKRGRRDGDAALGQAQLESHIGGHAGDVDALQLACFGFALHDVDRLDHR